MLRVRLPVFARAMARGMGGVSAAICAAISSIGPSPATASLSLRPSSMRSLMASS